VSIVLARNFVDRRVHAKSRPRWLTSPMPKLLVLFQSRSADVVRLAEAAAAGARTVRFAEVDLRRLPVPDDTHAGVDAGERAHHPLEQLQDVELYDGLILVVEPEPDAGGALVRALGSFAGSLVNKVGAVLTPAGGSERSPILWSVLSPMADRGMILVPAAFNAEQTEDDTATRDLGKRVAEVISWMTHARSHHHHESHHHDHSPHHHH
jgi:hypothetical protein